MQVDHIALLPMILGLVELGKRVGLPSKWSPVLACVLGVLIGGLYLYPGDWKTGALVGVAVGLGASGLYSGFDNVTQSVKNIKAARAARKAAKSVTEQPTQTTA